MPHSHDPKKWIVSHTPEQIEHIRASFDIAKFKDRPFSRVDRVYAYKYNIHVRGRIGRFRVDCMSLGEHRDGVEYNLTKPLLLKDCPETYVSFEVLGTDGEYHTVYPRPKA